LKLASATPANLPACLPAACLHLLLLLLLLLPLLLLLLLLLLPPPWL